MELQKAYIRLVNSGSTLLSVMFNPMEYTLDKSNQFQNTPIIGLSTPLTQFINGNTTVLTMDLFFDTYETKEDVNTYTNKMMALLDIDKDLHAPPICEFVWGTLTFKATVEKITRKFTMFLENGTPVRATLNVTFKEYKTLSEQLNTTTKSSSDRSKIHILKAGETLSSIAGAEYGDPGQWRKIAQANNIVNPRLLESGKEIIIPPIK